MIVRRLQNGSRRARRRGFTLLEIVISIGLMGLLIATIFRVAQSSMQLSQTVVEEQNVTMERNAFFNLLKGHFEQIPGNAVLRLESYEVRDRDLFTLTFQNVPMSFNWGDVPMTAETLQLATVEQRDGFVDVVLRFYDVEILEDTDSTGNEDAEPVAEITLIEDMWLCDCEVIDANNVGEPLNVWDNNGRLPLQVKLYCRFTPTSDIVQQTFWVVPKQNPEVIMRQIVEQNPGGPDFAPGTGGDVGGGISVSDDDAGAGGGAGGRTGGRTGGRITIPGG